MGKMLDWTYRLPLRGRVDGTCDARGPTRFRRMWADRVSPFLSLEQDQLEFEQLDLTVLNRDQVLPLPFSQPVELLV